MAMTMNVQEAKTRLSEILRKVESGEEVVIARAGRPVALIKAVAPPHRNFDLPLLPEIPAIAADALFEEDEAELSAWEDGGDMDPLSESSQS